MKASFISASQRFGHLGEQHPQGKKSGFLGAQGLLQEKAHLPWSTACLCPCPNSPHACRPSSKPSWRLPPRWPKVTSLLRSVPFPGIQHQTPSSLTRLRVLRRQDLCIVIPHHSPPPQPLAAGVQTEELKGNLQKCLRPTQTFI